MDQQHIDEEILHAAARLLFGNKAANRLRRTYNIMSDVAESAWRKGFDVGLHDGAEVKQFRAHLVEAAQAHNEQEMAADAQLSMDAVWGLQHGEDVDVARLRRGDIG